MRPRCGQPMKAYSLNGRPCPVSEPVCGRPADHSGQHLTTEAYQRYLRANQVRQSDARRGAA